MQVEATYSARRDVLKLSSGNGGQSDNGGDGELHFAVVLVLMR
jgi:hypothetical protein